jgi:hypothetical protein
MCTLPVWVIPKGTETYLKELEQGDSGRIGTFPRVDEQQAVARLQPKLRRPKELAQQPEHPSFVHQLERNLPHTRPDDTSRHTSRQRHTTFDTKPGVTTAHVTTHVTTPRVITALSAATYATAARPRGNPPAAAHLRETLHISVWCHVPSPLAVTERRTLLSTNSGIPTSDPPNTQHGFGNVNTTNALQHCNIATLQHCNIATLSKAL